MAQSPQRDAFAVDQYASQNIDGRLLIFQAMVAGCLAVVLSTSTVAQVPLEGFVPLVGMGLTDEFDTSEASQLFFVSESSEVIGGQNLGNRTGAYYDVAVFDTGAATHILSYEASGENGFDITGNGFEGNAHWRPIGGASGAIVEVINNDPLGVYAAGLGDRSNVPGGQLKMNPVKLRGQTSFSTLSPIDSSWRLPSIIGLPMAAAHSVHIQNSDPLVFLLGDQTIRTPQIDFHPIGEGGQGIARRAPLKLPDRADFAQGPFYVFDTLSTISGLPLHENPATPSVIPGSGIFIDVDLGKAGSLVDNSEFLFDTGASYTVLSTATAALLGIDPMLDSPAFTLTAEGSAGPEAGIPGYILDKLSLDTAQGSFELTNVPVAVLDVANPADPGNIVTGILGMNVFADRDIVIDANPLLGDVGLPPSLYISDPVTVACEWTETATSGNWSTPSGWSGNFSPDYLCDVRVTNASGSNQEALITAGASAYRATIAGTSSAEMALVVEPAGRLVVYQDVAVNEGGRLHLQSDATRIGKVNAQFMTIQGGALTGSGEIYVGAGPVTGSIRNHGLIAPGDSESNPVGFIFIDGDVANRATLEFDLGGNESDEFDNISASRNIYLEGTLDVNLVDLDGSGMFTPMTGDTFTLITAGESVVGEFENLVLPRGFTWDVNYLTNLVQLQMTGIATALTYCDADSDGDCDLVDLDAMYAAFGAGGQFDFDGSGTVDAEDIHGWLNAASDPANPAKLSPDDLFVMGDLNLDGDVNSDDLGMLLNNFSGATGLGYGSGNLNGDEVVSSTDLGRLLNNYHFTSSAAATVPEPDSLTLLLLGFLACIETRRVGRRVRSDRPIVL